MTILRQVGTRIVLSPHEYFQFDQTLKNVVVNSESAFWDFCENHLLEISKKASRRDWGASKLLMGGPPKGGRPRRWSTMVLHMALPNGIFLFGKGYSKGTLGFFV